MAFNIRLLLRVIHNLTKIIFRTMQMHLNIEYQVESEYTKKETNVFFTIWLSQHKYKRKTVASHIHNVQKCNIDLCFTIKAV